MTTVLVVDDSPMLREMLSDLLTKSGLSVTQAVDGLEAKERIEADPPDLVIMDIVMPRMNGYELCRWIKSNPATQAIPVIMCSTKNEEFDRYWGMKQGGDAYVAKPFRQEEMMAAVKQLLNG
ncbi:two-component system response regulator [Leptolyngbya sp. 'hensonii']|uniref:response regulator transcription factor n=1 Tax=Leptolyngbya sp. 'hensonii' TaxID=1922337 RepID=UPI00094F758A|nr:response regulator [Leptolyngbya sp. 'hensonii']OLP16599.1 two-component system response regulator [Leptolyngbya sp. 'hensonii']